MSRTAAYGFPGIIGIVRPALGSPEGNGVLYKGAIRKCGRIVVGIQNLTINTDLKLDQVPFPKVSLQRFEQGQVYPVTTDGSGHRHHRCGKGGGSGNNIINSRDNGRGESGRRAGREMPFSVIGVIGVVEIGMAVTGVARIDQKGIIFPVGHEPYRICDDVLYPVDVSHHVVGIHVVSHIVEPARPVNVGRDDKAGGIYGKCAFAPGKGWIAALARQPVVSVIIGETGREVLTTPDPVHGGDARGDDNDELVLAVILWENTRRGRIVITANRGQAFCQGRIRGTCLYGLHVIDIVDKVGL